MVTQWGVSHPRTPHNHHWELTLTAPQHIIVIIEDWGSDGPTIWVIYEFHFMKGKKDDNSAMYVSPQLSISFCIILTTVFRTYSVSHTIANTKAHYDTVLELVAIAIHPGVFEVDLRSWLTRPDLRPPKHMYPFCLTVKDSFKELPVFTSATDKTQAMSYSTLNSTLTPIGRCLGWD